MKRSEINQAVRQAAACFAKHHWMLPPNPKWDVTDFGLGSFEEKGLVLINLAEEPEYCEKLMYARKWQTTPAHCHAIKKEDIIVRMGELHIQVWNGHPEDTSKKGSTFSLKKNGENYTFFHGEIISIKSGERITLTPHIYHAFWPVTEECIIGEVSTANDDVSDNYFADKNVGRYAQIIEDEPADVRLVNECTTLVP